jgi:hypothetical protein
LKILINTIELLLISYSLKVRNSFNDKEIHLKVLTVGLAWTLADSLASYMLYFLMNATGEEFKWEYIQSAILSNLDLIERIAVVALVQVYESLRNKNKLNFPILIILIAKYFFTGIGFKYIDGLHNDDPWSQLIAKGLYCLIFAFISKYLYFIYFRMIFNSAFSENYIDEDFNLEQEALREYEKSKKN